MYTFLRTLNMEVDFPNSIFLLENALAKRLYQKLIIQLNKDFQLANVNLEIPLGALPDDVVSNLREKIYHLIMERFPTYLNLLYVVDVSEAEISNLSGSDAVEMADQVCFLILKRIWKKVWLKEKYS